MLTCHQVADYIYFSEISIKIHTLFSRKRLLKMFCKMSDILFWPQFVPANHISHLPLVRHICVSELDNIGSGNGLSLVQRQAITWTNAGFLSIGRVGINVCEIWIEILAFSIKKMRLKCLLWNGSHFVQGGDEILSYNKAFTNYPTEIVSDASRVLNEVQSAVIIVMHVLLIYNSLRKSTQIWYLECI